MFAAPVLRSCLSRNVPVVRLDIYLEILCSAGPGAKVAPRVSHEAIFCVYRAPTVLRGKIGPQPVYDALRKLELSQSVFTRKTINERRLRH